MSEQSFTEQLDQLLESYRELLKTCYDALDESVDQATRDSIRKQIEDFVSASTD
jgi:DNA-binding ferritin-like protein